MLEDDVLANSQRMVQIMEQVKIVDKEIIDKSEDLDVNRVVVDY